MKTRTEVVELADYFSSRLTQRVTNVTASAQAMGWKKTGYNRRYSVRNGRTIFSTEITFQKEVPEGPPQENPLAYTLAGL